jgi:serine/threonine-protein phosphatase PP1 catalytic subunit
MMEVKGSQWGKAVKLDFKAIKYVVEEATKVLQKDPLLLELEAPIKIFGDVHGQYFDLFRLFDVAGYPAEGDSKFLFIGDYVDRGKQSIETIIMLLTLKLKFPKHIYLLRGNHESQQINRMYGFYDECKRRYSVKTWKDFGQCFNSLPVCAIVDERILCMHGGLSPDLNDLEIINKQQRDEVPD